MPYTPEFARAVEIERQIKLLVAKLAETYKRGEDTSHLNRQLDLLESELTDLRSAPVAA